MKNHTHVCVINNPSLSGQDADHRFQTVFNVRTTGLKIPTVVCAIVY